MLYADDATKYTTEEILKHYKGTGHIPASTSIYNRMAKEQLLCLKEMLAITTYMVDKGFKIDPGLVQKWEEAIAPIEVYVKSLENNVGSSLHQAKAERTLSDSC